MDKDLERKEEIFAMVSATLAQKAPFEYKPLIFASPISTRDPNNGGTWHPYHIRLSWPNKFIQLCLKLASAILIGMIKISMGWSFYYSTRLNDKHKVLIVIASDIISYAPDGSFNTPYLKVENESDIDWLILGYDLRDGRFRFRRFFLQRRRTLAINYILFKCALKTLLHHYNLRKIDRKILIESILLFLIWIYRQDWLSIFALGEIMKELVRKYNYTAVFSPHEMHPYSRTVWFWAKEYKLKSATLQHALIYRDKLQFFPTETERRAGLKTPDIFFIYSSVYSELLKPYMPNTQFILGASSRFRHYKHLEGIHRSYSNERRLLIVTSACWFDINTMLSSLRKLFADPNRTGRINLRLHPSAKCLTKDSFRIKIFKWRGSAEFSQQTLTQDLENAGIVIGCGSSVIFEAILRGIPTLIIQDDRFCNFNPTSIFRHNISIKSNDISWKSVEEKLKCVNFSELQGECIDLLGLDKQIVDALIITHLKT